MYNFSLSLFDSDSRFTLKGYIEGEKTKVAFKEREVTRERGSKKSDQCTKINNSHHLYYISNIIKFDVKS